MESKTKAFGGQATWSYLYLMDLIILIETKIRIFLTSCEIDLWQVVLDEYMDPKFIRGSWDEKTKKVHSLNSKVINGLFCSLCETKYTSILGALLLKKFGNFFK